MKSFGATLLRIASILFFVIAVFTAGTLVVQVVSPPEIPPGVNPDLYKPPQPVSTLIMAGAFGAAGFIAGFLRKRMLAPKPFAKDGVPPKKQA